MIKKGGWNMKKMKIFGVERGRYRIVLSQTWKKMLNLMNIIWIPKKCIETLKDFIGVKISKLNLNFS
ncbi:unnamed protein product [Caenorhabditis angaria]|uniref:Uncharacterized protein n=1 Tax=Caenorhabditis angaria TaxID=860376 RepID=A0A9P1J2S4_9PELO|nr:unnamed protein product [Caenorhabditis angaria]